MKQVRARRKQKQINLLQTTVRKHHSREQVTSVALWSVGIMTLLIILVVGLHIGLGFAASRLLFQNDHYALKKIVIEPEGQFSPRSIRQAAGLELGQQSLDPEPAARSRATCRSCPTFPARRSSAISRTKSRIIIHERAAGGEDRRHQHRSRHARGLLPRPRLHGAQAARR